MKDVVLDQKCRIEELKAKEAESSKAIEVLAERLKATQGIFRLTLRFAYS
jgi:hypothetical protein